MKEFPDKIIKKAVDLWCKQLLSPFFDNGDNSFIGMMGQALATMKIEADRSKIEDMERRIEVFREALTEELFRLRDCPEQDEYFQTWLYVDYHPCPLLAMAADKDRIPHSQFSCKSNVHIRPKFIASRFGYGADYLYHYPLEDGRWLVTTITGSDDEMSKIFNHVLNGNELDFYIDG